MERRIIPARTSVISENSADEQRELIEAGKIRDIALARFGNRSGGLVAVVKVQVGESVEFWSLTMTRLGPQTAKDAIRAPAALLMKGQAADQVLALSATRKGTIFTVVIGNMSQKRPGAIDAGAILIDGCPFPTPSNGRIGHFRTIYVPKDYDEPDKPIGNPGQK